MAMKGEHVFLRRLAISDADSLLALRLRNRDFYRPFEPIRPESHFTLEGQEKEISQGIQGAENDQSYMFGVFLNESEELIGRITLTGISRGPFQNASLGYYMDQQHNGKGYATEGVSLCIAAAFNQIGLHRVQAGVMPRNLPSVRVLEKCGFRDEGLAKKYLNINGVWEDHRLFAMTLEDYLFSKSE